MSTEHKGVITKGWLLGLGMIVPITIATVLGGYLNNYVYSFWQKSHPDEFDFSSMKPDLTKDIVVDSFHDARKGKQVIVLGVVTNKGKGPISSATVEAEFFNEKGEFVYESSTYVRKKLKPNESENFQISCGCGEDNFPEYKTITVRVVDASNF